MRLRARLLLFSTAQLLVFAGVCALAYGAFHHAVVPRLEADDAIIRWADHLAIGVALIWMVALGYSLAMARELRDYLDQITAELDRREADRKLAATRADVLQNELAAVSRVAGMAEIATGVLHNVGNVLNSLNVSVSMISDQVKASRIAGLTRSIELVETYPGGLPAFLATEKGKVLPSYLSSVSRRLSEENAKVLEELGSVNRHVDHIKTIVAMQQSYARPSGVLESIMLSELVDDALHMGESSFVRHGIEIVKDYAADVALVTDRHRLLQIMINLISNARHALKDHRADHAGAPPRPQQLIVRIRCEGDTTTIAVIDNGVGIPADNLAKIFRHGFTTKQGGHGFGLHASANTARELGGSIAAASDGPGQGATFTLTLPAAIRQSHHDLGN
jgi:signal transduction histidine kinase